MALMFSLESQFNFHVIDCKSAEIALGMLDINTDISAVILAGQDANGSTEDFYMEVKGRFPSIPFICTDSDLCSSWKESPEIKHSKNTMIQNILKDFENLFQVDTAAPVEKYTAVSLKTLAFANTLSEDAYIKLISGRYVKLFSAGDRIDELDVSKYQKKGVGQLYLDHEACTWMLREIVENIESFIEDENFTIDLAPKEPAVEEELEEYDVRELFEETDEDEYVEKIFYQETQFLDDVRKQKKAVVNNIKQNRDLMKMLSKIDFVKGEGSFLRNRMLLTSALSCSIAKAMGWDSEQTFEKLIYCSHVHDIMLIDIPKVSRFTYTSEAELALSEEIITETHKERFLKHTIHAAQFIKKDLNAPPDAATMVMQHHELPSGDGFPHQLSGVRVNAYTAILAISINLSQFLMANKKKDFSKFIEINKARYRGGNFTKVMKALAELTGSKY